MNTLLRSLTAVLAFTFVLFAADSADAASAKKARSKEAIEAATRLQVFLDRAEFAPGKIDGHYGEFTIKALALYRESKGESAAEPGTPSSSDKKAKATPSHEASPDVSGLDLASVDPVFLSYTVTDADLNAVGELPDTIPAQAKQKSLPYKSAAEAIAERFHTDVDFLGELNPGKTKAIKVGDVLTVPNVEPFDLPAVKEIKAGSEIAANDADEVGEKKGSKTEKKDKESESETAPVSVKIDTKTNMLSVYDANKLIAAYPVTIGSAQTASPIGDWKVSGVAKMPNFRYDKSMLNKGQRSSEFHMLPPGPNNPVGVIWIQLNKKGIGLHGTNNPDDIGRNASHGCVRLANWDIVRLAPKVKTGVPVSIH